MAVVDKTPVHRCTLYLPGGKAVWVGETRPLGKLTRFNAYCKYCFRQHASWWLMDWQDYFDEPPTDDRMLLCGRCEHTSLESNAALDLPA
jgi:hypothetical protein